MTLQFSLGTTSPETADTACVVVGVYEQGVLTSAAAQVDSAAGGSSSARWRAATSPARPAARRCCLRPDGVKAKRVHGDRPGRAEDRSMPPGSRK